MKKIMLALLILFVAGQVCAATMKYKVIRCMPLAYDIQAKLTDHARYGWQFKSGHLVQDKYLNRAGESQVQYDIYILILERDSDWNKRIVE